MASDTEAPSGDVSVDQVRDLISGMAALLAGYSPTVGMSALSMTMVRVLVSCYQDPNAAWEDYYDGIADHIDTVKASLAKAAADAADAQKKDGYQPE